ncbi:hypothetical protein PVAP13_1NG195519 [Panicum virgatum]|uniref:Uncharacterized protein n=1 Tax=Panicum virgatum TaxID=38727 RepID=A0A8T0WSR8_PANVG|nr:hypothetical protein PVAP13_1NG195519 [Panicum virgatum]
MSLRALGSLLIRRSSPRGIRCAQAPAQILGSASGRPPRSLHTLRDLDAGVGALGALAAGGLGFAALVGILYFQEDELEVTDRKGDIILDETIRATFMDKDGNFAWLEYIDYINFEEDILK